MIKNIFKFLFIVFIPLLIFSFWMSPRLGGIIPLGKEGPDKQVEVLGFDTKISNNYGLKYDDLSQNEDLVTLRTTYKLDSIVQDSKSDFEKIQKIQSWVQSRWEHDGNNTPEKYDVLYILKEAEKGERFRCVEYSYVARKCLSSLGFRTRGLGLMTKDISEVKWGGGHVANEIYLNDLNKWMFIDPQFDVIAIKDSIPLNAVELQSCISKGEKFEIINPNGTITKVEYIKWIGPYLYYFQIGINGQPISIWDRIVGNKKQLTLLSKDAKRPKYFQKIFRINNSYYTNSLKDFYPKINKYE